MSSLGPGVPAEKQLTGFDLPVLPLGMGGSRKFKGCRCETSLADEWPVSRRGHWQRGQDTWQGGVEYEAGSRGSRDRSRGSQSLHLTLGGKLVGGWSHAGKSPSASSHFVGAARLWPLLCNQRVRAPSPTPTSPGSLAQRWVEKGARHDARPPSSDYPVQHVVAWAVSEPTRPHTCIW